MHTYNNTSPQFLYQFGTLRSARRYDAVLWLVARGIAPETAQNAVAGCKSNGRPFVGGRG